jgi:hypothetical protein
MAKEHDHGNHCERSVERLLVDIHNTLSDTERQNQQRHDELIRTLRQGRKRVSFTFEVGVPQQKDSRMPLELKITNEQQVDVTVSPRTDSGKPAKLDGSPAWTVISGNSQVVVSEDGLSATLVSSDEPGDTIVSVKADADLGEGVEEIADTITLSVIGATAKNLGLTAGTPTQKHTV